MPFLSTTLTATEAEKEPQDKFAPKVNAKLLFATTYGGPGDQWFAGVRIRCGKVQAANKEGLGLSVTINEDDTVSVRRSGNPNLPTKKDFYQTTKGGKTGPFSYRYNQVDPILPLPWLKVGGRELWGWKLQHAKKAKATYAPFMSDSRIRRVIIAPNKDGVAIGSADGGNTCLRAHPYDINRNLKMGAGFNQTGGGGLSSWLFNITPRGQVIEPGMVFRGQVSCAAWDEWGRIMVGGQGVMRNGRGSIFGYDDGAGILMASADWEKSILQAHFGKKAGEKRPKGSGGGQIVSIAIDSKSGLAAVCGYLSGQFDGVEQVQDKPGGGKDAFLAVMRLWTPEDYEQAKAAEKEAKSKK